MACHREIASLHYQSFSLLVDCLESQNERPVLSHIQSDHQSFLDSFYSERLVAPFHEIQLLKDSQSATE